MIVATPATHADWIAWLEEAGVSHPPPRRMYVLRQISLGRSWAFRGAEHGANPPAALAGIVHMPDMSEAWFEPGHAASLCMPGLVRAFRRQIAIDARGVGVPIIARVRRCNAAGQRLAEALGFERSDFPGEPGVIWYTWG